MTERFEAGAYWGSRPESVSACAHRLSEFLRSLVTIDASLSTWYETGTSREAALRAPVATDAAALEKLLLAGRHRGDFGHDIVEELGFSASVWNGQPVEVGLHVACGMYPRARGLKNQVDLLLPTVHEAPDLFRLQAATRVIEALVIAWDPDWATFESPRLRHAQDRDPRTPVIGWLTYLSGWRGRPMQIPSNARIQALGDGILLVLGDDPTTVGAAELKATRSVLADAGCLEPTP